MAYNFPETEKNILAFWEQHKTFEKLRKKNSGKKRWSFLDGPITANNPMGVHHAWGRTYKDIFQRYNAMKGFDERYQNGFDCQGLWVEVEVEKELGFKTKKDIEVYGIDKFVEKCKERVMKYSAMQTAQSVRLGQWMDWENSYYTMSDENNYAIWHFLKKCHEKGYLYKGRDSVPWCPRCGTAISQHEILTEEYKEITHDSVYFSLPLENKDESLLVWTTTPWTLPANIAVAVDEKIDYVKIIEKRSISIDKSHEYEIPSNRKYIIAKDLIVKEDQKVVPGSGGKEYYFRGKVYEVLESFKGSELVGLKYSFAFDNLPRVKEIAEKNPDTFHTVIATDDRIMPITTEDGTGMVHTAVSAGAEDFQLGKKLGLPLIEVIGEDASYLDGLGEFSGQNAKKNPKVILDYLATQPKYLFEIVPYKHKYPTCWRCKTELVWRVVDEWYISMDKLRKPLEEIVKKIQWIPGFGLDRELDWIKNMHDWLISKKRYWGLTLPIYECECGHFEVLGSREELEKRAVEGFEKFEGNTPHRPWVDYVKIRCKKCKKIVSRIKDVGNPWLDAGIVPFSTMGYFSDKAQWKKWFPAQVVCESFPGQFKNWFYSLLVMSAVLEDEAPIKTIFGYASVVDEKGEEMHKSKGNSIPLEEALEKVGADPARWLYAKANPAENMRFGYTLIEETKRKLLTLQNVYTFFTTYVQKSDFPKTEEVVSENILDKWIVSKMDHVIGTAEFMLDKYDIGKTVTLIEEFFINDLSLWYLRRSRKRFHEEFAGRSEAIQTLYYVLLNTAKIIAPVMPFFAEQMYQDLRGKDMPESVHLCDWPSKDGKGKTDLELEANMDEVRNVVTMALAERSLKGVKIRQPLLSLKVKNKKSKIKDHDALLELIKDEVNVKQVLFDDSIEAAVELDLQLTEELKEEGMIRDVVRSVQDLRKEQGYKPEDKIMVWFDCPEGISHVLEKNEDFLLREVRGQEFFLTKSPEGVTPKEFMINGQAVVITIKKI